MFENIIRILDKTIWGEVETTLNDHPRNNIRTKPRQGCGECNSY